MVHRVGDLSHYRVDERPEADGGEVADDYPDGGGLYSTVSGCAPILSTTTLITHPMSSDSQSISIVALSARAKANG